VCIDQPRHDGGAAGIEDWGACRVDTVGWPQGGDPLTVDEQAEPALQLLRTAVGQTGIRDQQAGDGLTAKRSGHAAEHLPAA
jgi:hypothetical protein